MRGGRLRWAIRRGPLARRRPGLALTVVVTLGLGIGATSTIYSVVDTAVDPVEVLHAE